MADGLETWANVLHFWFLTWVELDTLKSCENGFLARTEREPASALGSRPLFAPDLTEKSSYARPSPASELWLDWETFLRVTESPAQTGESRGFRSTGLAKHQTRCTDERNELSEHVPMETRAQAGERNRESLLTPR